MTPDPPRALLIGRFQPPHLGHQAALARIASASSHLTIGVGSAQHSHSPSNPFTAGERVAMLEALCAEIGIRPLIIPMFDMHRNTIWVSHVVSQVPPFDVVYTNNPLPARLFREAGREVRSFDLVDRARYSGTDIRRRMAAGEPWHDLVPKPVARLIEAFDGPARLKDVQGSDDPLGRSTWVP